MANRHARPCVANNIFIAAPNRIGVEPETDGGSLEFFGHSFICDTSGRYVQHVDEKFEGVMTASSTQEKSKNNANTGPISAIDALMRMANCCNILM